MQITERSGSSDEYRYGFNGKEKDDEVKGGGVQYDYGFRIYDVRIGKFLSQDPLFKSFPWYTPYQFSGNSPISCVDLDGLERYFAADGSYLGQSIKGGNEIKIATAYYSYKSVSKHGKADTNFVIESSKTVDQFSIEEAGKVYQTIYEREIKGNAKVIAIRSDDTDAGGYGSQKNNLIEVNINNNWGISKNYYDVNNTLFHEEQHIKGALGDGFSHFEIWKKQINHKNFQYTSANFKEYARALGDAYIEGHMVSNLSDVAKGDYGNKKTDVSATFDLYYKQYTQAIDYFNKIYSDDKKPYSREAFFDNKIFQAEYKKRNPEEFKNRK